MELQLQEKFVCRLCKQSFSEVQVLSHFKSCIKQTKINNTHFTIFIPYYIQAFILNLLDEDISLNQNAFLVSLISPYIYREIFFHRIGLKKLYRRLFLDPFQSCANKLVASDINYYINILPNQSESFYDKAEIFDLRYLFSRAQIHDILNGNTSSY
jgi:hypothetical protein